VKSSLVEKHLKMVRERLPQNKKLNNMGTIMKSKNKLCLLFSLLAILVCGCSSDNKVAKEEFLKWKLDQFKAPTDTSVDAWNEFEEEMFEIINTTRIIPDEMFCKWAVEFGIDFEQKFHFQHFKDWMANKAFPLVFVYRRTLKSLEMDYDDLELDAEHQKYNKMMYELDRAFYDAFIELGHRIKNLSIREEGMPKPL